jgi:hypothetical protein
VADEQTTDTDAGDQTPVEATEEDVQVDLAALIDEVRVLAVKALDECKELRAIITEEALDEAADDSADDDGIEPEDLQIEDLLA